MDAGSGTGILSELLLDRGATVFAVEPNEPMREESVRRLGTRSGFQSFATTAEETGLPESSVDLITAAQAFHWFDVTAVRREWTRVLRPGGWVALMWNERQDTSEFALGYRALAHAFVEQSGGATPRLVDPAAQLTSFFSHSKFEFANHQDLDLDGLKGRALSSSYWPRAGAAFEDSMARLEDLFESHARDGLVRFDYVTELYLGQLN
jgi:SAM-dependent methyltransferase